MKKFLASTLALIAGLALCLPAHAARTDITVQSPGVLLSGAPGAGSLALTFTAADVANMNQATFTGKEVILANNTGLSPYTVTVTSVADPQLGRTQDIATYSIPAGAIAWIGPLPTTGWQQTNGKIYFQGSNAAVTFAVVKLSGSLIYK